MTQRVNLLTEDIKPDRPILSFKHSFGVLGLVVGLFVVMSAYEGFRFANSASRSAGSAETCTAEPRGCP